jgi:O-antigen/teichoic acid export membrane protein
MVNRIKNIFYNLLKSDLNKSIFSGYALFFMNNVVALFLTPYMLKFVTKQEYGLYILCVDFLAWVGFLEFGTSKVVESKAGHLIAKDNQLGLIAMFNSSYYFQLFIGLLIIPIFYFSVKLGIGESQIEHTNLIILLFSVSAGFSVMKNLFSALIIASKKVYLDNSIQFFINVLNYILVLSLTPFIGGLGLALISLFIIILTLIRSRFRILQLYPYLSTSIKFFDSNELKSLFSNGIYFSLGSIATVLISKIDSFVLGKYMGLEMVTSYYISIKLFILAQKFIQILYNNYRPYISNYYGKGDFQGIRLFYNTTSWFLYSISTVLIAITIYINQIFVTFWVGKEYLMNIQFSILFGLFILLDLYTLPSRVVLVSSLFKIRSQSFLKILEGLVRISIVFLLIDIIEQDVLPFSSLLSGFIFGNLFFFHQIKLYFKENGGEKPFPFIFISMINLGIVLVLLLLKLNPYIPFLLLIIGSIMLIYSFKLELENLKLLRKKFILTIK